MLIPAGNLGMLVNRQSGVIMMLQQIRWLITLFCMRLRLGALIDIHDSKVVEHVYSTTDARVVYEIKVVEKEFKIDYGKLWLPILIRRNYYAVLTHIVDGEQVCTFKGTYPPLSMKLMRFAVDEAYPLITVADTHLKIYLEGKN